MKNLIRKIKLWLFGSRKVEAEAEAQFECIELKWVEFEDKHLKLWKDFQKDKK